MASFIVRYDLRCPAGTDSYRSELYAAALDQAAYCETSGFEAIVVSEHHSVDDGYLPSPLIVAGAIAARTTRIPVVVAALLAALHDPVRMAEDIAVLDHLSGGRIAYVLGLGYRPEEYSMFGRSWQRRGALMDSAIETMLAAWTGEPFDHDGRTVRVTPTPLSRPHPMLLYGGGSVAAVRRAARFGLGFSPQVADDELADRYRAECRALGREPGPVAQPAPGPGNVFCATDPDEFWERYGLHLLHDATSYREWHTELTSAVLDRSRSVGEMRDAGVYVVWSPEELIERCRNGTIGVVTTHPLCGGLPPAAGWEVLRLLGDVVIPALG